MTPEASLGFRVLNRIDSVVTWTIFSVFFHYLRKFKGVGHQQGLLNLTIFFGLHAVLSAMTLVSMAWPVNTWVQNTTIALIVVYGLWLLLYLVSIRDHIRQTFVDSEWLNKIRGAKAEDQQWARELLLSQATESRRRAEALYQAVDSALAR